MAPCSLASRVIPRITDSVNEWVRRAVCIEAEVTRRRPRRNSPGPWIERCCYSVILTLLEIPEHEEAVVAARYQDSDRKAVSWRQVGVHAAERPARRLRLVPRGIE